MKKLMLLLAFLLSAQAGADELLDFQMANGDTVRVPVYKSRVLQLDRPARRVSVGNPAISDILILRSSQLYVLGKSIGTTNVMLWDDRDRLIRAINVEVTHDLHALKGLLHDLLPGESIQVHSALNSLVLSGSVSTQQRMQSAMQVAQTFLQQLKVEHQDVELGSVINMMNISGNHQVMLEVKVAELARTVLRRWQLGHHTANYRSDRWTTGTVNGGGTFPDARFDPGNLRVPVFGDDSGDTSVIGPAIDEFMPAPLAVGSTGLFASFVSNHVVFNSVLDAAKQNGLAKILAEPTLTTQSGKEAEFLSGGEFPIPVPQGLDAIAITFKEFGVGLRFLPVVVGEDQINLQLSVSVSDLVNADAVTFQPSLVSSGFFIPALSKRSASTTVELKDGQTIGIAGLISEDLREVVSKFPGLGDIPVIGHLFRSQEFVKGETELVILVTPRLARPLPAEGIDLPTDQLIEPSEMEFYLMGRMQGQAATSQPAPATSSSAEPAPSGAESSFGHSLD